MPNEKQRPVVGLTIKHGDAVVSASIEEIARLLGLDGTPDEVAISLTHDGTTLTTSLSAAECDYPGMTVDAMDGNGNSIYLANVELPNESFPDSITARLYGGYAAFETDGPIAIVRTQLREPDDVSRLEHETSTRDGLTKYVHIDKDVACSRSWTSCEDLPEHV